VQVEKAQQRWVLAPQASQRLFRQLAPAAQASPGQHGLPSTPQATQLPLSQTSPFPQAAP